MDTYKQRYEKQEKGARMKEIKVIVEYTEGHEKRFTEACLEVLKRREVRNE